MGAGLTRIRCGLVIGLALSVAAAGCQVAVWNGGAAPVNPLRAASSADASYSASSAVAQTANIADDQVHGARPTREPAWLTASSNQPPPPAELPAEPTVNLAGALDQANIDNPTIALAEERITQATAEARAARALMLPSLNAGTNLHIHRGNLQQSFGNILDVSSQSLYYGGGAKTLAAESVAIPAVRLFGHVGDAIILPRVAAQVIDARAAEARATRNDILLEVAAAYWELSGLDARVALLKRGEDSLAEIVRLTHIHAEAGQGRQADADRALANFELLRRQRLDLEGERGAVAARLAGLLNLDPTTDLLPTTTQPEPVQLVNDDSDAGMLLDQAIQNRPERRAAFAALGEARLRNQQEYIRPWMPTLIVGMSGGEFGGGSNLRLPVFGRYAGRTDFDAAAFWTLQNFGIGNHALQRATDARVGQASAQLGAVENRILREVEEALAELKAAKGRLEAAQRALPVAQEGSREEFTRIRGNLADTRPLEALDSFRQLAEVQLEVVESVTRYNIAQFRLWVAIGGTPYSSEDIEPRPPTPLNEPNR